MNIIWTYFDPYWHIETAGSWFFGSLSAGQVDALENPWPCTLPIISTCKMGGFSDLSTSQWVRKIQKGSLRDTTHVWRMWKSEKVQTKQRKVENLYELVMLTFDGVSPPISNHHFHHPARCLEPPRWPKPAKGAVPWLIDVDSQKINAPCSKLGCETMIHSQRCEDLWCRSDAFQTHESHETKSRETMGQWESYPPDLLRLKAICLARCIPMQPQGCWIRSVPADERGHACHVTEKLANA
jgi:hypothetical protein